MSICNVTYIQYISGLNLWSGLTKTSNESIIFPARWETGRMTSSFAMIDEYWKMFSFIKSEFILLFGIKLCYIIVSPEELSSTWASSVVNIVNVVMYVDQ